MRVPLGRPVICLLVMLAATAATGQVADTLSPRQHEAVRAYEKHLAALKGRASAVSLERLFVDALRVRDLLGGDSPDEPSIENVSEGAFLDLQRRLPGIVLNREEVILAEPDTNYFFKLASTHGGKTDREFFRAYQTTFPDSVWPVYVQQQTDFSGCTVFGERHLTESYHTWVSFRRTHPNNYRTVVKRIIKEIEGALLSTCACGDRESVIRELREFTIMFPTSPVRPVLIDRLRELEAGNSPVRFHCSSG
jgi:hypothetical protein